MGRKAGWMVSEVMPFSGSSIAVPLGRVGLGVKKDMLDSLVLR